MKRYLVFGLKLAAVIVLLISCDPSFWDDPKENIYTNGEGTIGAEGGTITVEDANSPLNGVSIEIPEGALAEDIEISVHEVGTEFILKEFEPESFWIKMEPAGAKFEKPVKIGIPYEGKNPDEISMRWSDGVDQGGEVPFMELDQTKKIFYAGIDHFTYFGLTSILGGSSSQLVQDTRDDKYYVARKVGTQWWFTGDAAYNVSGSRVYNDADSLESMFGRLYNWQMAKQACPSGWRLPTKDDWIDLELEMGMTELETKKMDGIRTQEPVTLKLRNMGVVYYLQGAYFDGEYCCVNDITTFWTSTESFNNFVWSWQMFQGGWFFLPSDATSKDYFYSVKCMK